MLNNILNIHGVSVLDKKQQSKIKGGSSNCVFRVTYSSGNTYIFQDDTGVSGSGASSEANQACVQLLGTGDATNCGYDCEWDGYTALWNPLTPV